MATSERSLVEALEGQARAARLTELGTGVNRTALAVLRRLAALGPQRVTTLAVAEHTTQPGMTGAVNRLVEQGWVARVADPDDGRAILVQLTEAGHAHLERVRTVIERRYTDALATLPARDLHALHAAVPALIRLSDALAAAQRSDTPTAATAATPASPHQEIHP